MSSNAQQAPEPEVLKRKRSRPSDWWANGSIIASTPQQIRPPPPQNEPEPGPAKKRGRPSAGALVERTIQDAPAAANRGKPVKKRRVEGIEDDENGGDDELAKDKPARKERSSATGVELLSVAGPSKAAQSTEMTKNKPGRRPAATQVEEEQEGNADADTVPSDHPRPRRRGRPAAIQAEQQAEVSEKSTSSQNAPKAKGRPSGSPVNGVAEAAAPIPSEKPLRRGRSSNTEAEVRAVVQESTLNVTKSQKRGRGPTVEKPVEVVEDQGPQLQENPSRLGARPFVDELSEELNGVPSVAQGPKKRGQQPTSEKVVEGPIQVQPETKIERQKRREKTVAVITQEEGEEPIVPAAARRRTRRSDANVPASDLASSSRNDEPERDRPRTKRLDTNAVEPQVTAPRVPIEEERGRRRTRLSDVQSQQEPSSSAMTNRRGKGRKSSRGPQTTTLEAETASSKLTKAPSKTKKADRAAPSRPTKVHDSSKTKKRAQPSSSSAKEQTTTKSSQAPRKNSKQNSAPEPAARKRKSVENHKSTPNKRPRLVKEVRQDEADVPEAGKTSMLYQYLKPVVRKISLQKIDAKWEPLPPACVERVSNLLQDLQRPVMVRLNEQKNTQAGTALQMISRRLISKLSKGLPFPPATRNTREEDFDFEKVLDHNRSLEAQLTPALHGNELLEAELAKEMARLEADKDILAELEANAKSETTARNEAARKLHPLLQSDESTFGVEASRDDVGIHDIKHGFLPLDLRVRLGQSSIPSPILTNGQIQDDENLQGLIKGLHGHVDTIQGNIKQVGGISEAIVKSKAAVQATLFDHLGSSQYGEVILGSE
ncbi:uncharacterized protein PAC_03076 [Phialocephala subalpina]|uniref:Kinetochore protein fta7 n=1 Tax=Phialocephala subalpina TaxID=576137 RepID=A0A1L7WK95_9HELO|nr:uncharacterized protein PAC_03076 [Phialocephala subalpina]